MRKVLIGSMLLTSLVAHGETGKSKPTNVTPVTCEQQAKSWFEAEMGERAKKPASARPSKSTYRAHYNATLKTCLTRLDSQVASSGYGPAVFIIALYQGDPRAKKSRGSVVRVRDKVTHCLMDGKTCASVEEWESLVKPLLKE